MIVSMSTATADLRLQKVLDAAYVCFTRHGVRKTTMEDIAAAAGMSRPAVYQYVRSKDDAYRRLAARVYDGALAEARTGAASTGTLAQRLDRALAAKLALTERLFNDSPYAHELTGRNSLVAAELERRFLTDLTALLAETITSAAAEAELPLGPENAHEIAELALALARGLEAAHTDLDRRRDRLRNGIALLVAGLAAATRRTEPA
jgi:TetR/AcrR family transcriptional regulator